MPQIDEQGLTVYKRFDTTPGRLRIGVYSQKIIKLPLKLLIDYSEKKK